MCSSRTLSTIDMFIIQIAFNRMCAVNDKGNDTWLQAHIAIYRLTDCCCTIASDLYSPITCGFKRALVVGVWFTRKNIWLEFYYIWGLKFHPRSILLLLLLRIIVGRRTKTLNDDCRLPNQNSHHHHLSPSPEKSRRGGGNRKVNSSAWCPIPLSRTHTPALFLSRVLHNIPPFSFAVRQ